MNKHSKSRYFIIAIFVLLTTVTSIFMIFSSNAAANGNYNAKFNQTLEMKENANVIDQNNNVNDVNINLPSAGWNISSINLNFTDIKLGEEINSIEEQDYGSNTIYYQNPTKNRYALSTQLNISASTDLFGVYIYGRKDSLTTENISVQIQGYDELNENPDGNIWGEVTINMSTTSNWYYQDFSAEEITLPTGNYSLVLNGTDITSQNTRYYWALNDVDPNIPYLHTSEYSSGWSTGLINSSYLCKLHQKTDRTYLPSDINMTANICGDNFKINDKSLGSGNLSINSLDIHQESQLLDIPILTNQTIELIFNVSYNIAIFKTQKISVDLEISDGNPNDWTLTPQIQRYTSNTSVKISLPYDWEEIEILRNNGDLTSQLLDGNNEIFITNQSIINGASWTISAISDQIDFNLDLPEEQLEPEQELKSAVSNDGLIGNITFVLVDSLDLEETTEIKEIDQSKDETVFSYTMPSNPHEGEWTLYAFWYNGTAAGVQKVSATVTVPFTIDPQVLFNLILVISIASVVGISLVMGVRRSNKKREVYRQRIYNKYMDTLNLQHIIITEKQTGLSVYEQQFAGKDVDASLITGFLEAIRTFGIELASSEEQSQTIKLDYQQSKVLMSEYKNFRIILVMSEEPSQLFLDSLDSLSVDIEKQYGVILEKFRGNTDKFVGIRDLLEKHLLISLIYPLKLSDGKDVKTNSDEESIIKRAKKILEKRDSEYFFVANLLAYKKGFQVKDAETILNLIHKDIFEPLYL